MDFGLRSGHKQLGPKPPKIKFLDIKRPQAPLAPKLGATPYQTQHPGPELLNPKRRTLNPIPKP